MNFKQSSLPLLLGLSALLAFSGNAQAKVNFSRMQVENLAPVTEQRPNLPQPIQAQNFAYAGRIPLEIAQATANPLEPAGAYAAVSETSAKDQRYVYFLANFIQNYNRAIGWEEATRMADAIIRFSDRYGVDFRLLTGVIAVESSFRFDAVSSSGAIGLGQLKPDTAKWLGVVDPYNPVDNIAGTARFLGWLIRKYNGSLDHALSAYYQGPGFVDRNGIAPVCVPYLHKINRALGNMM